MNLYLVRHADSRREEEDPQKSLTDRGWNQIGKMAIYVARHTNIKVGVILHSGKTRASQTASVLAEHLKPSDGIRPVEGLAPMENIATWLDRLSQLSQDTMLVGHLPHLGRLTAHLLCENQERSLVDLPPAGILALRRNEQGTWKLRWMLDPDLL